MDNKTRDRDISLDILRITATLAVIMLHTAKRAWYLLPLDSVEWGVSTIYDGLVRWAVPVFVMISGYLFLSRDNDIKKLYRCNILRIATAFLFWSAVYAWLWWMQGTDWKNAVKLFIKGNYHLWFLPMIIGLYMAVPILKKIVSDDKLAKYFLAVSFAVAFVIPQLIKLSGLLSQGLQATLKSSYGNFHFEIFLGYPFYFVLGYMIKTGKLSISRNMAFIMGVAGAVVTVVPTVALSLSEGKCYDAMFDYMTVNVLMEAVFVFVFFNRPVKTTSNIITTLSKASFGAYLIHEGILLFFEKKLDLSVMNFNAALSIPALFIVAAVISFAISCVLNKVPHLKKYIV